MAVAVVMPALEMAQETGVLVRWLKREGESVAKGEPLMEVETDKATVEIEATAAGILGGVSAAEGDKVPVGRTIAWVLAAGEEPPAEEGNGGPSGRKRGGAPANEMLDPTEAGPVSGADRGGALAVTPLARRIAEEYEIDLSKVKPQSNRIEKADVLAYVGDRPSQSAGTSGVSPQGQVSAGHEARTPRGGAGERGSNGRRPGEGALLPASPKARRLAAERGVDLANVVGSGPAGAVLAADVVAAATAPKGQADRPATAIHLARPGLVGEQAGYESPGSLWRIMAARMSESWTNVPHFYLMREVEASRLLEWRARAAAEVERVVGVKATVSDLLLKSVAHALRSHRRLNSSWEEGAIRMNEAVNVGIAVATEEGLVVPVIASADRCSLSEIAARRSELVERARNRKLRPEDLAEGTFTVTNLGMYRVDAFNAIVNPPQAAILAVGRVADRVVPVDGRPEVRPTVILTLSCDHRVADGAQAALFLDELVATIEDPWRLLV